MARNRQGWRVRRRTAGGVWYVRFQSDGHLVERSTGTGDRDAAQQEAARIYANAIALEKPKPVKRPRVDSEQSLEVEVGQWLVYLVNTHDPGTLKTWELYAGAHFIPWFGALHNFNTVLCDGYLRDRLGKVLAATVRHERTALRSFITWAQEHGKLPKNVVVPPLPKRAIGKAHGVRRRSAAIEISPEEVEAVLAHLPTWSASKKVARFPIRARFVVAYETGLRPSTLDRMLAPLNYRAGSKTIKITADLDKSRWVRDVPITERARRALDEVLPEAGGLIFGKHEYRPHLKAAAEAALPKDRAEVFCGAHLRSAMITHSVEKPTTNLAGVQFQVGHTKLNTTARYMRPSQRAALANVEPAKPAEKATEQPKEQSGKASG